MRVYARARVHGGSLISQIYRRVNLLNQCPPRATEQYYESLRKANLRWFIYRLRELGPGGTHEEYDTPLVSFHVLFWPRVVRGV